MQQVTNCRNAPSYVGKFVLYLTPSGELLYIVGNQRMHISQEEAKEMLDFMLAYAQKFARWNGVNSEEGTGL